jgi:hypothetical protein
MDAARNATTPERYTRKTQRARMYFMRKAPEKRPTVKAPCAPARYLEPVALEVPGQVSTT